MEPCYREAGSGPAVICLHANASTSGQWRGLMDLLAPRWHVVAPDGLGAGKGAPWPSGPGGKAVGLADEVEALRPLLARLPAPWHLVGHSYGAAVALKIALTWPDRVAGLVLYEPTLFAVLLQQRPDHPAVAGIADTVQTAGMALDRGDTFAAARIFIDYWMGEGAFDAMPPSRQAPVAESVRKVRGWSRALMGEAIVPAAFAALDLPVSLLCGGQTRASARAVSAALAALLPRADLIELQGLGHMAPVTQPDQVNPVIAAALGRSALA
ncbi:Hydrolase [Rubrivivax sp. A210]|uniref:alpha/beta fold hydrolase n=1 Tax=Rubrivivax sp. A210 TaxID=2772301 RepID=UPI001918B64B|nr:alpha/beta hydrolase [Rubrivivax sp. A210]CAD5372865.1 Hydrolase [Rubrivivax sp. A210]